MRSSIRALGARQGAVLSLVLKQGPALAVAGLIVGLAGAIAVTRYLEKMLFGVSALEPITFVGVSIVFALIAFCAYYAPARRATKIDPLVALRYE
jgi:putative ABC transport system permease protein